MEALDTTNTADDGNYSIDEYRNTLQVYVGATGAAGGVLCSYGAGADKFHYTITLVNQITLGAVAAQTDLVTIINTPA